MDESRVSVRMSGSAAAVQGAAWNAHAGAFVLRHWMLGMLLAGTTGAVAAQGVVSPQACIAPSTFVELTGDVAGVSRDAAGKTVAALGSYERISPDGRFVLRSYSGAQLGNVSVMELPAFAGTVVRGYRTPLSNEAFPVQGSWRYVVDMTGEHYRLADVLQQQGKARPLFRGGMTGFYAAAAELPGSRPGEIRIRSFSWPNAGGDDETQGQGALSTRTITVDVQQQRVTADTGTQYLCRDRVRVDGSMYALPMISVDGREYAAMPQMPVQGKATMRVFGFGEDGKGCELRDAFAHASGKTVFGFPGKAGQGGDLAYEYRGQIWWYSRALKQAFNLAPPASRPGERLMASAFPGITRDGRVIYASTLRQCDAGGGNCSDRVGYTIADPYQSASVRNWRQQHAARASSLPQCVTRQDVVREREAFAQMHGLAP